MDESVKTEQRGEWQLRYIIRQRATLKYLVKTIILYWRRVVTGS